MATEDDADDLPTPDGPDAAGAIVPPRNPDGTPGRPAREPEDEAGVTDVAADAINTEAEAGEEVPQP